MNDISRIRHFRGIGSRHDPHAHRDTDARVPGAQEADL